MTTEIKSVSTRTDTAAAYDHYLQVTTGLKPEDAIYKSLEKYGIKSLPDLLFMGRDDIDVLEYIDKYGSLKSLHHGDQDCVKVTLVFLTPYG